MFTLPKLDYAYDALEPYIDAKTMEIHHTKHHQTYVDNLNKALEKYPEFYKKSIEEILSDVNSIPEDVRQAVINHGGGHANHSLFWQIMGPKKDMNMQGTLFNEIKKSFGGFDEFKEQFNLKALGVFGSGWAFLVVNKNKELELTRQSFQNSPLSDGSFPLLGIDVWEHAYYLKYQNRRAEYVEAWWNVINWEEVEKRFSGQRA